jgi:8-oxo-dGTP pyrophosphatase MutT (NUDIX family)
VEVAEAFFRRLREVLRPVAPPVFSCPEGARPAGVLVPLRSRGGEITAVLARRSERVPHHKGQICFPGGSRDPGDVDLLDTALREAWEEVGISREDVEVIGTMEPVITVTGFCIQPYVSRIPEGAVFSLDGFEMAEVFDMPLSVFSRFENYRYAEATFQGRENRVYFFDYGPHTVWGATAMILRRLAELVRGGGAGFDTLPST